MTGPCGRVRYSAAPGARRRSRARRTTESARGLGHLDDETAHDLPPGRAPPTPNTIERRSTFPRVSVLAPSRYLLLEDIVHERTDEPDKLVRGNRRLKDRGRACSVRSRVCPTVRPESASCSFRRIAGHGGWWTAQDADPPFAAESSSGSRDRAPERQLLEERRHTGRRGPVLGPRSRPGEDRCARWCPLNGRLAAHAAVPGTMRPSSSRGLAKNACPCYVPPHTGTKAPFAHVDG